jgi:hypothetical protein
VAAVRALLHYLAIDTFRSQRWVAPVLTFGAIVAIACTQSGSVLPTYAITAAALLFVATWLSIVVVNNEDTTQQSITSVCAGSRSRVRMAKLLVAFLLAVALGLVGMIAPPLASSNGVTGVELLAGFSAQVLTALAGVALGALCSRPLIVRRAWSVLLGAGVCLATVIVPHCPPTRQLLVLFNRSGQFALGIPVLVIALETLAISAVAVGASLYISSLKS